MAIFAPPQRLTFIKKYQREGERFLGSITSHLSERGRRGQILCTLTSSDAELPNLAWLPTSGFFYSQLRTAAITKGFGEIALRL